MNKTYYISSTWIDCLIYNASNGNMTMVTRNGLSYSYNHIPQSVFNNFLNSSSHGTFWNRFIKGRYI